MNVVLKERTLEHARIFYERSQRPIIQKWMHQKATSLEEAQTQFVLSQQPNAKSYGNVIYADDVYIGDIWCHGLHAKKGVPLLSCCIFDEGYWRRGIGSQALSLFLKTISARFDLSCVGAYLYASNSGSRRVLEKNGFQKQSQFFEAGECCYYYEYHFK